MSLQPPFFDHFETFCSLAPRRKCRVSLTLVICLGFTGCDTGFGTKFEKDPREYGRWESYLDIPAFLPDEVDGYQVNGYSYALYAYMDICYEIFVDITATQAQLEQLLAEARSNPNYIGERAAYYCEGYYEITFQDCYELHTRNETQRSVGLADIEKVIYHPGTRNIIYVCFHANDTGVYPLDKVAYFQRFSIREEEYVKHLR